MPVRPGTPPRTEQLQQRLHAFARCLRLQSATMACVEIERVAGLPTMDSDGSLTRHDWALLLLDRLARGAVPAGEHGKCAEIG
jgi:hypothetical protein